MAEVIDAEGYTVGQTDSAFDPDRLLRAYEALFGPGATEKTFRWNVRSLWNAWAELLKDTGLRKPKPGLGEARTAVLTSMKRYNQWRQDVLALPEGRVGEASIAAYDKWHRLYSELRDRVQGKTAVRSPAPENIRARAPKRGGFLADFRDSFLLVGAVGIGAWILFGRGRR